MPTAVDASTTNSFSINLFQALLFAFIGGLILNLMPCVFPVIALKALSFIKISEHAPHQAKWHGWSYTVGVLSSFVAIALVLIGLKAAENLWDGDFSSKHLKSLEALPYSWC